LREILWCWLRWLQNDALAEQVESGAVVHPALDRLDLVDGAFDDTCSLRMIIIRSS
jgi:hypothetical protein